MPTEEQVKEETAKADAEEDEEQAKIQKNKEQIAKQDKIAKA